MVEPEIENTHAMTAMGMGNVPNAGEEEQHGITFYAPNVMGADNVKDARELVKQNMSAGLAMELVK